ncbi:tRNA uridine-5-carboxymethylaminomethyl(34) synthesis GTPase MnmE [Eubacteriales bacterium DFI.9.88]|nr:tRNA uridine-5-carboxymethylaminomethyl(34) synthesis GTPase MnmE [Eubacteriales bacterium DFI.9.88]
MEETIAAIATAYGEGGIGIVRISGPKTFEILEKVFIPARSGIINRKLKYGYVEDPKSGQKIDEVLAVFMKEPYTYTKEDVAEIHCHGSMVSLRKTLELVLRQGARMAEPGEFTKRAFLNGRLDLSQAEAVIDLIRAKTDKTFDVALGQLDGQLSQKVIHIRKALLDLLVNVTVNIDYPDEDIEEMTYEELEIEISQINDMIEKLLVTADTGRIIREGLNVAIIGKPNVGKSSLMNELLKETRAIVTDIPGTTRDTIEEVVSIKNIPVRLTDTAGIRKTDDTIEKMGIEKSKKTFNEADLIIFVMDSSREISQEDQEIIQYIGDRRAVVLINKIDLGKSWNREKVETVMPNASVVETSLLKKVGIEEIEQVILDMVYSGEVKQNESLMVTNVRHKELLEKAKDALADARHMTLEREALDFIEVDLKNAYEWLGEIIGETVSDDIINEVFSRFCLGK